MYLQKKPGQKFYYLSRQGEEDVLFLKIFDSKTKGIKAPCESLKVVHTVSASELTQSTVCPHASFKIPYSEPDGVPRQSIEVRCLVFSSKEGNIPLGYHQQVKKKFAESTNEKTDLNGH